MKVATYLVLLFIFAGCVNIENSTAVKFYDADGTMYRTTTAASSVKKEFNLDTEPRLVVVATSSKSNPEYKEQMRIILKVDAEEMQYMYIIANSEEENHSGYFIKADDAKALLAGDSFKIIIYGENGEIMVNSRSIIEEDNLKMHLTRGPNDH